MRLPKCGRQIGKERKKPPECKWDPKRDPKRDVTHSAPPLLLRLLLLSCLGCNNPHPWIVFLSVFASPTALPPAVAAGSAVSLALSLSLSRRLETVGSALVLSSTDGDETRNPHLSLSPRRVSSGTKHGIRVFAACEVLTLRFLPCCVPVAWSSLDDE